MNKQTTTTADRPEVIETLADLWAKVGIRAIALPKIGRAVAGRAHKTAVGRSNRPAQAAQVAAVHHPCNE